jgi:hypothetical protein
VLKKAERHGENNNVRVSVKMVNTTARRSNRTASTDANKTANGASNDTVDAGKDTSPRKNRSGDRIISENHHKGNGNHHDEGDDDKNKEESAAETAIRLRRQSKTDAAAARFISVASPEKGVCSMLCLLSHSSACKIARSDHSVSLRS